MFKFSAMTMNRTDLQERVEQLRRGFNTKVRNAEESFGQKISKAVKQRLAPFSRIQANAAAEGESFGEQVKEAAKKRAAETPEHQKNSKERAAKDRSRYHPPQPRKHSKSD